MEGSEIPKARGRRPSIAGAALGIGNAAKTTKETTFDDVAVLVSDMTGFTSGVRKHGIVHVASTICRMRQICLPILHGLEAKFVGFEGDNLIVVMPDAASAVNAAIDMRASMRRLNASLPEEMRHHEIKLGGIGVHCGGPVVLDRETGGLHGPVRRAGSTECTVICPASAEPNSCALSLWTRTRARRRWPH